MDLNTTALCGESVQLYIFLPWVQGVLIALYVVIFVIGIGGNLLVLAVVLGNKHKGPQSISTSSTSQHQTSSCVSSPFQWLRRQHFSDIGFLEQLCAKYYLLVRTCPFTCLPSPSLPSLWTGTGLCSIPSAPEPILCPKQG